MAHVEEISKTKILRTCHELARHGVTTSGFYEVDPDGELIGHDPINVFCTFTEDGQAITEILHDSEDIIRVEKCSEVGCFTHDVKYDVPLAQIKALASLSESCEQKITFGCFLAPLSSNENTLGGWLDRNGKNMI